MWVGIGLGEKEVEGGVGVIVGCVIVGCGRVGGGGWLCWGVCAYKCEIHRY